MPIITQWLPNELMWFMKTSIIGLLSSYDRNNISCDQFQKTEKKARQHFC